MWLPAVLLIIALLLGMLLGWLLAQRSHHQLKLEHARLQERLANKEQEHEQEQSRFQEQMKALSAAALRENNQSFLQLAEEHLKRFQGQASEDLQQRQQAIQALTQPLQAQLQQVNQHVHELERSRQASYARLDEQLKALVQTHIPRLHEETGKLVKALRQPSTRGRWGEIQLRRVVEMAGMQEHCDFLEQRTLKTTDDKALRPDMQVKLPAGRTLLVDAKAPVDAYLSAVESDDDATRQQALRRHAQQIRTHIKQLSSKHYQEQLENTPEFVVLFVPGEAFFSAALMVDAELIEYGNQQQVILASPTTLIALLKAVAYGWQQESIADNAKAIAKEGQELYSRLRVMAEHWNKVGKALDQGMTAYNKASRSMESRVMVSARRFQDFDVIADQKKVPDINLLDEHRPVLIDAEDDSI